MVAQLQEVSKAVKTGTKHNHHLKLSTSSSLIQGMDNEEIYYAAQSSLQPPDKVTNQNTA